MMESFGTRLIAAMRDRAPLCVGIDPHPHLLRDWGLPESAEGLRKFSEICVEAFASDVAAVKPQSAFFERYGSAGIAVLEQTIAALRERGTLVILDAKRGDIDSTASAYASAYLNATSPLFVDALTVSPYLGFGSLDPFVEAAESAGSGLFVLARTSNADAAQLQSAALADGRSVAQYVVDEAAQHNRASVASGNCIGNIGVVVGATTSVGALSLADLSGPILSPGVGEQGAGARELAALFGPRLGVLPSISRAVLRAGPDLDSLRQRVHDAAASVGTAQDRTAT